VARRAVSGTIAKAQKSITTRWKRATPAERSQTRSAIQLCQYANDFGILAWGPNSNIHDNVLKLQEGRGIEVSGGSGSTITRNTITNANELENDAEYNGCEGSGAYGIQWDDGIVDTLATDNNVTVLSSVCTASALRLTHSPESGNNTSSSNSYTAVRTSSSLPCTVPQIGAPSGCAVAVSTDMDVNTTGFTSTNDTFTGDSAIFWFDWDGAYNVTFINPTFNKGIAFPSSPWYFAIAGNGFGAVSNVHIRDATFGAGVDPRNNIIPARNAGTQAAVSFYIDWTYTLVVTDQTGNSVTGARVTVMDSLGNQECNTSTVAAGIATCVVTQERIHNDTGANQVEDRNPMAVSTSKSGCVTNAVKGTVSQTMNQAIQLSCQ
jgi:parallel beta-helix repeat protein